MRTDQVHTVPAAAEALLWVLKAQQWSRQSSSGAAFLGREVDRHVGLSGKGHKGEEKTEGEVGTDILYR